jgi:hypothetical protein
MDRNGLSITTKTGTAIELTPGKLGEAGGLSIEGQKTDMHFGNTKKDEDKPKKKPIFGGTPDPEDDL